MIAYRPCVLVLVLSALLMACGGGGTGVVPQNPPQQPPPGVTTPSFDPAQAVALTGQVDEGAFSDSPQVVFGADGDAVTLYRSKSNGQSAINARRFVGSTRLFDSEQSLHQVAANLSDLRLKVSQAGDAAVAVWTTEASLVRNVFAAVYRGGVWQQAQNLSQLSDSSAGGPDAAFDATTGEPVVVWTQGMDAGARTTEYSRLRTGRTVWEPPRQVTNLGITWSHSQLRLAPS